MGIDPGPVQSAVVILDDAGRIVSRNILNNEDLKEWLPQLGCEENYHLCIEMIASYGMSVGQEVFETCVWIGRFMAWWGNNDSCKRLTRIAIKNHICHSSRANDMNIRQALIDRYGAPGKKNSPGATYGFKADMWAALAVATTAFDKRNELYGLS